MLNTLKPKGLTSKVPKTQLWSPLITIKAVTSTGSFGTGINALEDF